MCQGTAFVVPKPIAKQAGLQPLSDLHARLPKPPES